MLNFIPAWYQQNSWSENEQYWYSRRARTEFDDTVKQVQLFHRSGAYPFQVMLLSYAPNYRHFLHRQSVFHAPYWSCFDAIQEIRKKKVRVFSYHNLQWPEHVEFVNTPFAMVALLHGEKYAQVEFAEDGNMIQIDLYEKEKIVRRNIYDDRGFISGTIIYRDETPFYQDYLNDKGIWKLRHFMADDHIEINPKQTGYLIECGGQEYPKQFQKSCYDNLEEVIEEVLTSYLEYMDKGDMFCVAMHARHTNLLHKVLKGRKTILSFFENRYEMGQNLDTDEMLQMADYVITDSKENLSKVKQGIDITPFDSRVDFGISQQLSIQKILVPVDGMNEVQFRKLMECLAAYLPQNENARVHIFTRVAAYDRKRTLLEQVRNILEETGMNPAWANEQDVGITENRLDNAETSEVRFIIEQCVDELSVSKCMREQRLVIDMRNSEELYLRIAAISGGIPQIVFKSHQYVEDGKNGMIVQDLDKLSEAIHFYLDNLTNWNEAMVYSYEMGKKYTTKELIDKWKEVIRIVGTDSDAAIGAH